jgi:hypothetical protein
MNEQDLRDCFALMLTVGLAIDNGDIDPKSVWKMADALVEARNKTEEQGIAAAKPKKARKP